MADSHAKDVAELSAWIDSLLPTLAKKAEKPLLPEPPEEADALVIIATEVKCRTCEERHVSSSHILRRIKKSNGAVVYKPCRVTCVGLPHVVEWAYEQIDACWKCFDLAERLQDPEANLALAPETIVVEDDATALEKVS